MKRKHFARQFELKTPNEPFALVSEKLTQIEKPKPISKDDNTKEFEFVKPVAE